MTTDVTLLLVRHGQSTWNAEGRWQGQANPPLTDKGRAQAVAAAERIGAVDAVVSSPQDRALTTAQILAESIGIGPVLTIDGLAERNAGPWSGLTRADIEEQYPGFLEDDRRPDGYESDASLLDRTLSSLEQIAADHEGTVLVATHGGVIHNLESHLGLEAGRVPNLSGRIVHRIEGQWQAGDQLTLLDGADMSGGDPQRI